MTEFDVSSISDDELLTPAVRRYLDRLLDVDPECQRELKIKRLKEHDMVEFIVKLTTNQGATLSIYQMRYTFRENINATLNSPALVKVIDIYDNNQVKEVWESV